MQLALNMCISACSPLRHSEEFSKAACDACNYIIEGRKRAGWQSLHMITFDCKLIVEHADMI